MQAGKRRCEVTKVTAAVGSGEKVATDKVRELEILVDGKRFEDEWNKPVAFSVASTLPSMPMDRDCFQFSTESHP
jgi:hypothetical protein